MESHTAVFVLNQFESVLTSFGLSLKPNHVATTDKGSNMTGALGISSKCERNNCSCHLISTFVNRVMFKTYWEGDHGRVHGYRYGHITQMKEIFDLLEASFKLVEHFNRTKYVKNEVTVILLIIQSFYSLNAKLSKTLKKAIEVRWNSLYKMLSSILQVYDEIVSLCATAGKVSLMKFIGKDLLSRVVAVLEPFQDVTLILEKTTEPTIHKVMYCRYKLATHLAVEASDIPSIKQLKNCLLFEMNERWPATPLYIAACLLDPMQKKLMQSQSQYGLSTVEINKGKKLILETVRRNPNQTQTSQTLQDSTPPAVTTPSTSTSGTSKRIRFDDLHLLISNETNVSSLDQNFEDEWKSYMQYIVLQKAEKFDRLLFWKNVKSQYELLSYAAKCILAIPASASKCESDFSIAGKVKCKTRASLSPKNLNSILTIRANADLITEN
jgi:hypothetical protein